MIEDDTARLLETRWDTKEKQFWELFSFRHQEEYIVAIAIREKNRTLYVKHWE